MKKIYNYIGGLLLSSAIALTACSPEDFPSLSEAGVPLAADYADKIEILVDQETNQVTFNLKAAGCMPYWHFVSEKKTPYSTINGLQRIFASAGDYTVEVQIANANGISDGIITKTFHIDNTIVDFDKYITFMSGGTSKEWYVAQEENGHLGCGPTGTDGLEWYSAAPNAKADMGLYDDIVTFGSEYQYTYNPGDGGTVYVNTGCSIFPEYNPGNGEDFMVPVEEQQATYSFEVVGEDLFIVFPAKTLFPYIASDGLYNAPRYKVLSMTTKKMELLSDDGSIAWHYILTSDKSTVFTGFKYNSDCNMWRTAEVQEPEFWYAPNWVEIANPEYSFEGSTYKVTWTEATSDTWQAQMKLLSDIATNAATNYDFSVILNASKDHGNVTVKLVDAADDGHYYFAETVKLKAYEDYVFYMSDMPGLDIDAVRLVFDFGWNAADTEVTIKNIVLKEHSCDDGTVLPSEEPELPAEDVDWAEEAATNLWRSANILEYFYYYAPGWSPIDNPELTEDNYTYTLSLPVATNEQWQAQMAFKTDMATSADKAYDFRCILNATQDVKGATVKLVLEGDDNVFYFAERVDLTAYEDYVFKMVNMPGIDMERVNLFFDFGGNPENTQVTISGIILQEHGAGKMNWNAASDCNFWNTMEYTPFYYYAPGWTPTADPEVTADGNRYTIQLPEATFAQWQAQVAFKTDMTTNAATQYDFHCVLNANQDMTGVTVKLVMEGDDNVFYFMERVNLTAYEDYVFEQVAMPGIDMERVNLFFDFGGNPANMEVTVSDIILKENGCNN